MLFLEKGANWGKVEVENGAPRKIRHKHYHGRKRGNTVELDWNKLVGRASGPVQWMQQRAGVVSGMKEAGSWAAGYRNWSTAPGAMQRQGWHWFYVRDWQACSLMGQTSILGFVVTLSFAGQCESSQEQFISKWEGYWPLNLM